MLDTDTAADNGSFSATIDTSVDKLSNLTPVLSSRYNRFEIVPNLSMSDSFYAVFYLRADAAELLNIPECVVRIPFIYGQANQSRVNAKTKTQEIRTDFIYIDNFSSSMYLMGTLSPLQNISTLEVAQFIFDRHAKEHLYWKDRIQFLIAYLQMYYVEDEIEHINMQFDIIDRHRNRTRDRFRHILTVRYKRLIDRWKCRIIVWYKRQQRKLRQRLFAA